jgi:hypothetical protein
LQEKAPNKPSSMMHVFLSLPLSEEKNAFQAFSNPICDRASNQAALYGPEPKHTEMAHLLAAHRLSSRAPGSARELGRREPIQETKDALAPPRPEELPGPPKPPALVSALPVFVFIFGGAAAAAAEEEEMLSGDIPPNQTIYVNNLNEKVKKEGAALPGLHAPDYS